MNFIYFWRLAREKGFDLMVHALSSIVERTGELPGNIFVFWEGYLKEMFFEWFGALSLLQDCSHYSQEQLSELLENLSSAPMDDEPQIYFFGWQSQCIIRDMLRISHFSLMPSRFLETFGLSALESLSEGVPVLGFQKWGLVPFIQDGLSIPFADNDQDNIEAIAEKIQEVGFTYEMDDSMEHDESAWSILSHESRRIADQYTEGRWMRQIQSILPENTKKILIASDYTTLLWGIETHVQTIARVLRAHGYEVEIFGWDIPKGRWTKVLRLLGLVYSFCNITSAMGIRTKIRTFQPEAIWFHSVSRFLGPLVVREVTRADVFSLVTYHDLGLFAPFPSRVENTDMIPGNPSLTAFLSTVDSMNPLRYLAVYCKYFQVSLLRNLLRDINIHIVPSSFLKHSLHDVMKIPEEKTVVLEHFL